MSSLDKLFYWHGIADTYYNYRGECVRVSDDNRVRLLRAMGVEGESEQAIAEAVSLDLMEKDPSHDLSNEYSARVMMILANELGLDGKLLSLSDIQRDHSDQLLGDDSLEQTLLKRIEQATAKGCVVRHVASIDVASQSIAIRLVDVPNTHVFAVNPPSSECVRLFTHRYQSYPLVIQGPAAGDDCTSSALLAEVLNMMSQKIGPKSGTLSRSESSAQLT